MTTHGYIGTIEAGSISVGAATLGSSGTSCVALFSLSKNDSGGGWVEYQAKRMWFLLNLDESKNRPAYLAQLALIIEAMRERYEVEVVCDDTWRSDTYRLTKYDTFNLKTIRSLASGLHY